MLACAHLLNFFVPLSPLDWFSFISLNVFFFLIAQQGLTAIDIARKHGCTHIVDMLTTK
jgi:hypothetical protein